MSVYRRGNIYWYSFVFAGRRIQESARTTRKTIAVEAEKARRRELERALAGLPVKEREKHIDTISEILERYLEAYPLNHRPKSCSWVQGCLAHVNRLLGRLSLIELTETRLHGYIKKRRNEGAGNRTINMELACLSRAIGKPWRQLWPKLRKLEEPQTIGKALTQEEEDRLLQAAAANRSPLIYPFIKIALLTGLRFGEIRSLRWRQIDLEQRTLTVGRAKTEAGTGRVVPMSHELETVLSEYAAKYTKQFGSLKPEWFVFPACDHTHLNNPERPVTGIKTAWRSIRKAAGLSIRFHDLRHTTATKMAEAGVPEATMEALMGHMSRAMLERYSHVRMEAKRAAMEAVENRTKLKSSVGVSTKSTTVGGSEKIGQRLSC